MSPHRTSSAVRSPASARSWLCPALSAHGGARRRAALNDVGGYPEDTLAEDQDLTIAIQRKGWKVCYDEDAVAWTEAPETLAALSKQRFRWAFGTLQCLWKHRSVLWKRKPAGLSFVGMPQAWLFQILFALISPMIDLALAVSIVGTAVRIMQHDWAQTQTDVLRMGLYWAVFTAIDLVCGWVAYRLDVRERRFPPILLLSQRFVYRQLMYGVVIRAVGAALQGLGIGWGKLERTDRVSAGQVSGGPAQGGNQTIAARGRIAEHELAAMEPRHRGGHRFKPRFEPHIGLLREWIVKLDQILRHRCQIEQAAAVSAIRCVRRLMTKPTTTALSNAIRTATAIVNSTVEAKAASMRRSVRLTTPTTSRSPPGSWPASASPSLGG